MPRDLVLYQAAVSGNAYKVRLLLAQLGLSYRAVELDLLKGEVRSEEFRRLNPFRRVPFLVDDGFGLAESNAILLHLARGSPLLPEAPRELALVHQWMFFEQNELEMGVGARRYILRFVPEMPNREAILEHYRPRAVSALRILERRLAQSPFVAGEKYTVGDIALFGYAPLAPEAGHPLEEYPAIRGWIDRVRAQPGFIPM